jgi:hypothetical protein
VKAAVTVDEEESAVEVKIRPFPACSGAGAGQMGNKVCERGYGVLLWPGFHTMEESLRHLVKAEREKEVRVGASLGTWERRSRGLG